MKNKRIKSFWILPAFAAIYFVWGTTYLANIYALRSISPFIISSLRYAVAGLLLGIIARAKKARFPPGKDLKTLVIGGVLMLVGGSGLVVVAEQHISSGAAAVVVATEPLWFVILDKGRWNWYFSNKGIIAGLLIGFFGIALFAIGARSGDGNRPTNVWLGTAITFASCILWVIGTLFCARRIKRDDFNPWHTSVQLLAAAGLSSMIALLNGEWHRMQWGSVAWQSWSGLGFLIVFGSMIAYLAFAWLVTVQSPAVVSTHTYVNPVIAVFIGWLIAGEQVSRVQVLALLIALTGVIITQTAKGKSDAARKTETLIST